MSIFLLLFCSVYNGQATASETFLVKWKWEVRKRFSLLWIVYTKYEKDYSKSKFPKLNENRSILYCTKPLLRLSNEGRNCLCLTLCQIVFGNLTWIIVIHSLLTLLNARTYKVYCNTRILSTSKLWKTQLYTYIIFILIHFFNLIVE